MDQWREERSQPVLYPQASSPDGTQSLVGRSEVDTLSLTSARGTSGIQLLHLPTGASLLTISQVACRQ